MVDVANSDVMKQIESVNNVLAELGCSKKPILTVLNKVDALQDISQLEILQTIFADAVCVSAKNGLGLEELTETVLGRYKGTELLLRVSSSLADGKVQTFLRTHGTVISENYTDSTVLIEAKLGENQLANLKKLTPTKIEIIQTV